VTIVYWGVLFTGFATTFDIWSNASEHGLNSAFALFEIVVSRTDPQPWIHLLWLIVLLVAYLCVAYITLATKHEYVYNFLNPALQADGGVGPLVPAFVFGIAVAIIILFCASKGLITLRKWLTERKLGKMGKFHKSRGEEAQGDIELESQLVWEKNAREA
jgi:hypothetical protein